MSKAIFKPTNQNQPALFPFNFDGLIDTNHPVRLIDKVIEKLDITSIVGTYKGGGTSSYHPRMLLKVLIFGYLNNLFSSRKIANALKENVYFMWLSGQSFPDFHTINNFRGKRLKNDIENIFKQVVLLLVESDILTLNEVFTDGTKIESVANRYTFVWKKSVEKNKQKLEKNIQAVLKEIEEAITEDNNVKEETYPSSSLTSSELNEKIQKINQRLKDKQVEKTIKKKVEKLRTDALPKLQEYEIHLQKMGERNSYSKTDRDATFMRLKEDHMRNGQLKPAYNLQLSTERNFITNFSLHWRPGDTGTFIPHLQLFKEKYGQYPNVAVADAGFGSCENYEFLDNNEIESYVKYNYFHKEQSKKFKADISRVENLYYDAEKDYYICPMGQKMLPVGTVWKESDLDYKYEVTIYKAKNCNGCPLRGACHKQKGNRQIEVNKKLNIYKQKTRENLMSDTGKKLRGRRCSEVEQTFGQIKWNKGFKRFLLRGTSKVTVEVGLIALAHNLQKLSILLMKNDLNGNVLLKILALKPLLWQFTLIFKKHIQLKHKFEQKNIKPQLYSEIKKAA
jgi:transposase